MQVGEAGHPTHRPRRVCIDGLSGEWNLIHMQPFTSTQDKSLVVRDLQPQSYGANLSRFVQQASDQKGNRD